MEARLSLVDFVLVLHSWSSTCFASSQPPSQQFSSVLGVCALRTVLERHLIARVTTSKRKRFLPAVWPCLAPCSMSSRDSPCGAERDCEAPVITLHCQSMTARVTLDQAAVASLDQAAFRPGHRAWKAKFTFSLNRCFRRACCVWSG
ncbi:unnamed protein product, partial [Durusdinium trenchii]